jgi:hypothetical protein
MFWLRMEVGLPLPFFGKITFGLHIIWPLFSIQDTEGQSTFGHRSRPGLDSERR